MANSLTKIKTNALADDAVTRAKVADDSIASEHFIAGEIDTAAITDANVTTAKIAADAVTGAKIANDAVGSEHIEVLDAALQFGDDVKAQFGTGNDFEIYYNGTNTVLAHTANTGAILINGAPSESSIRCNASGSVDLYYDNSKKLETRDAGVNTLGNHYVMDDNFFGCGDGADLQIKHSATGNLSSITHSGAGKFDIVSTGDDLNIKSSENVVLMTNDTEIGVYVIKNGTVKLYHDGTEQCSTSANGLAFPSGKGIDFSATGEPSSGSSTSELMDDYEEGTFNPYFGSGTGGGTLSAGSNYSSQGGKYVKVGNVVHCQVDLICASSGTGSITGELRIENLPYGNDGNAGVVVGFGFSQNLSNTHPNAAYMFGGGGTHLWLQERTPDNGQDPCEAGQVTDNSRVVCGFTYKTV